MVLPPPVTNTDVYLEAVLKALIEVNTNLIQLASELQQLGFAVTQKPAIQLDAVKVAEAINKSMQSGKAVKSR